MDDELFRAADLTGYEGNRMRRLAAAIFVPVGVDANFLHLVADHNQFLIARPLWLPIERTLQFSLEEVGRVSAHHYRLGRWLA
jgi:hypothetical protein